MGYSDYGLEQVGSWILGLSPSNAGSMCFGSGSLAFDGTMKYLESEDFRMPVTWSWNGTTPIATITIPTSDANGSTIYELGLGTSATVGSDLSSRDVSAIGVKNASFSVNITMEVSIERGT